MNVRANIISTNAALVLLPAARQRALAQGYIVPIAERVAAVMFDEPAGTDVRGRLTALIDGQLVGRPMISTSLELRAGGHRHLLLLGRSAASLTGRAISVARGAQLVAAIDPEWLQPPLTDGPALIDGLANGGRRRLLKLFLTTGPSLFGFGPTSEFGAAARRLLGLLGVQPVEAGSWCPIGAAGGIVSFRMPAGVDGAEIGELVALSDDRLMRLAGFEVAVERTAQANLLHVYVDRPLPAGCALIGLGEVPLHLRARDASLPAQPLAPWLERRDAATRAWAQALVEDAASADPVAAATMRELCHAASAPPVLTIRHLSATPAGVLHALELADPHDLVRAVRFERGGGAVEVEPAADARGVRAVHRLTGYLGLARQSRIDDRVRIKLVYGSGRVQTVGEHALGGYAGEVPEGFAAAPEAAAAIARARRDCERAPLGCSVRGFGVELERPRLSIVAELGEDLDMVRARAAAVFAEPEWPEVEIIYHAADGAAALGAETALAQAAAVFGIPHRLVVTAAGADRSGRLLSALAEARGATLLLLGAEVLPAARGWLAPWLERLDGGPMAGGTLVDHAGAVVHAGGWVGEAVERRSVGLPARDLPPVEAEPTMLLSAGCVGLSREAVALLVAAAPYPNPDVMLAEAAAVARVAGAEVATLLGRRFVQYGGDTANAVDQAADDYAILTTREPQAPGTNEEGSA